MEERIRDLRQRVLYHKRKYYVGAAEISDAEYDALELELRSIDPDNSVLSFVGFPIDDTSDKVKHEPPMLSTEKALTVDKLVSFLEKRKTEGAEEYVASYKMDGMAMELIYERGILSCASSRGDGEYGEDVLGKVYEVASVPKLIKSDKRIVVRGEMVLTRSRLDAINSKLKAEGKKELSSVRNCVPGFFNQDEVDWYKLFDLKFFAYDLPQIDSAFSDILLYLQTMGFDTVPHAKLETVTQAEDYCKAVTDLRGRLEYNIDGIVFRVNHGELARKLGRTTHHYKHSIAFKFEAEERVVEIKEIEWSVGTKDITPVAIFDTINLAGADISRANLHSLKNMMDIKAIIGSKCILVRSGEVIPYLKSYVGQEYVGVDALMAAVPTKCPSCGASISVTSNFCHITCNSDECQGSAARKIELFFKALDIKYVGSSNAEKMVSVKDLSVLPTLNADDLSGMGISQGVAVRILGEIAAARAREYTEADIISALQPPRVGLHTARKAMDHFGGYDKFLNTDGLTLGNYFSEVGSERGPLVVKEIEKIKDMFFSMTKLFKIKSKKDETFSSAPNKSLRVCITGTLGKPRKEYEKMLEEAGHEFVKSVGPSTDMLVINDMDSTSKKNINAMKYNIKRMSESELLTFLTNKQ